MSACCVSGNAHVQNGRTFWPSGSRRTPWINVGLLTAGTPRDGNAFAYRWAQALTACWNACCAAWSCWACDFPAATACWRADVSAVFPSWAQALSRTVVVLMARVLTSVPGPYTFLTPAARCNFPSRWNRPMMLPAESARASKSRSHGHREGAAKTDMGDADSRGVGDGRAIVLVAKEERHQLLILNLGHLRGR